MLAKLPAFEDGRLEGAEACLTGDPCLEEVVEPRAELECTEDEDTFLVDSVEVILKDVVSDEDLAASRAALSLRNSLAEAKDLGGEDDDLEDESEDFLLEFTDETEFFLEPVETEDFLIGAWPNLTRPKLIASSKAISLPVSASVKRPVTSSMRPHLSAS